MKMKSITCLAISSILAGCGGGSDDSSGPVVSSVSGKVIDGYVAGATVYLDLNNNRMLDSNEPSAVSTDAGEYILELSASDQQCLEYVPIIVDVPVGAIDEDLGEVTEAYQLVLPPTKADVDHDSHITPLTTLAWDSATLNLSKDYFEVGCEGIKNNTELHKELLNALDKSTYDLGVVYNLTPDQIYDDFIANEDTEAHELATKIVEGYQRSFAERSDLIAGGASVWAYVYMYLEGAKGQEHEYYSSLGYTWLLNYGFAHEHTSSSHKVYQGNTLFKDGFSEEVQSYYHRLESTNAGDDAYDAMHKKGVNANYSFDKNLYECRLEVDVENTWTDVDNDFLRYKRESAPLEMADINDCIYQEFLPKDTASEFVHRVNNNQQFIAYYDVSTPSTLIGLDMNYYPEIQAEVESWNIYWNEADSFSPTPSGWSKIITEYTDTQSIETSRNTNGYYEKITRNEDGTFVRECSIDPSKPEFSEEACLD